MPSFGRRSDSAGSGPRGFSVEQLATIGLHEKLHEQINRETPRDDTDFGSLRFVYAKARDRNASWQFFRDMTERIGKYNAVHDVTSRIDVWEHWPKSVADIDAIIAWRARNPR